MTFPTTPILDNFSRANADLNTGSWGANTPWDDNTLSIVSDQAANLTGSGAFGGSYWTDAVSMAEVGEAYVTLTVLTTSTEWLSVYDGHGATLNGYSLRILSTGAVELQRIDAGNATNLVAGGTVTSGDVIGLGWDGAGNFTVYKNGTSVGTVTDTTYTGSMFITLETHDITSRFADLGGGNASATTTVIEKAHGGSWVACDAVKKAHGGSWV